MQISVGIDEAGRGPVIGPLVVACVVATEKDRQWFWRANVRDSKIVPAEERMRLAERIRGRCWFSIKVFLPSEIDDAVRDRTRTLNGLECEGMAGLLRSFREKYPDGNARITVDACSINADGFRSQLLRACAWDEETPLRAWHHADKRDRTVAAASLIAKDERERLIAELKKEIGHDFGCGYAHDEKTRAYVASAPHDAAHIRWTWKTHAAFLRGESVLS